MSKRRGKLTTISFPRDEKALLLYLKRKGRPSGISCSQMIIQALREELERYKQEKKGTQNA